MADIKAGVLLSLKDQFSQGIKGAGASVQSFSQKAVGAANKINDAFSGVAGTLGTLGVSLGALATVKATIDMEDRLTRLGLTADASAAQVNELKRQIFDAARLPHIKLDPSEIISALEVVMTKTGDLDYVSKNIENIAIAIKATGEEGASIGSVFSEFQKFSYSAEDISALMDDMVKQGDMGAFTFGEFAKAGSAVISAYSNIGTSADNIRKANAAMQIIMAGTKNPEIAVTALSSAMAELSDPKRQEELRKIGINVRDTVTGEFRDLNDIMKDLVLKAEEVGNTDFLGTIFGTTSMQAIRAYSNFGHLYEKLTDLGDTTGAMMGKSATMAGTMASNLQNLQTAWLAFGDERLAKPLEKLTGFLNYMAEHPKIATAAMWGLTAAVGALAAVRLGASLTTLIANLKGIKSGKIDLAGAAGGAGIPVHVTNWGGAAGSSLLPGGSQGLPGASVGRTPLGQPAGTPLAAGGRVQQAYAAGRNALASVGGKALAAGAITGAISGAAVGISEMREELDAIKQDESLTNKQRGRATGGAIGNAGGKIIGGAVGGVAGMAAGAALGAAVGSVIPGIGTAVGLLAGGVIGALGVSLGGKAGRAIGEGIGEAVAKEDIPKILEDEINSVPAIPQGGNPVLEGSASMDINVLVGDDRTRTSISMRRNTLPVQVNTGSAVAARESAL